MPPQPNVKSQVVNLLEPITIDAGPDDGRFLPSAFDRFPAANGHLSVDLALSHVGGDVEATLIGHGLPAFVGSGIGAVLSHSDKNGHVCASHLLSWENAILNLAGTKAITRLSIFACSVGAGSSGAAFVSSLADRLGATVRAPIGDVWIDDVTKQPCMTASGGWIEATPEVKPEPEEAPAIELINEDLRSRFLGNIVLYDRKRFVPLPFAAVKMMRWTSTVKDVEPAARTWSNDAAIGALKFVEFNVPLIFGGPLASFVTGRVMLTIRQLGREETREFLVHNDGLIEDAQMRGVFYKTDLEGMKKVG